MNISFGSPNLILQDLSLFFRLKFLWLAFFSKKVTWWRWWDSNPWPPACRAGALPAELHPHKLNYWVLLSPYSTYRVKGFESRPAFCACLSLAEGFRLPPFSSSSLQLNSLLPFHDFDLARGKHEVSPIRLLSFYKLLKLVVGPSGLEPPTSCLSGTRSNLLSYEPMWLVWILFTLGFLA